MVTRIPATEAAVALVISRTHLANTGALVAVVVIDAVIALTKTALAEVVFTSAALEALGIAAVELKNPWL
jgi:hypothetical protein